MKKNQVEFLKGKIQFFKRIQGMGLTAEWMGTVSELEDRTIEFTQSEKQRENRLK